MININLKPGHKRASTTASFAGSLDRLKGLGQKIKDPYRLGALALGLAAVGYVAVVQMTASSELAGLEPKLEQARAENQRFRAFLGEKRRLESVRDSIQAQIETIKTVDADRYVWPRILDEVARAVPPYTWLTDVKFEIVSVPVITDTTKKVVVEAPPVAIAINGRTVDIQGYTRLLRQLEDSPFLKNVTAVSANTIVDQNRAVTAFVLRANYQRPGENSVRHAENPAATSPAAKQTTVAQKED
jgi:Tfp pilus assembly protein PilN